MSVVSFVLILFLGNAGDGRTQRGTPGLEQCPSRPASRAKARIVAGKWYKKAIRFYRQKDYVRAHDAFVCTNQILGAGLTRYWIARSAQDAGLVDEALSLFEQLIKNPPAPVTRREIQARIDSLRKKLSARGKVTARHAGSEVRGGPDAGGIGKAKPGWKDVVKRRRRFEIVTWSLWGVGAGLLLTAVGLGTVAGLDQRAIENATDGTWWSSNLEKRYSRRTGLLAGTYTLVGAGLLAAAAGTALYFLGRPRGLEKLSLDVSPRGAGLRLSVDW